MPGELSATVNFDDFGAIIWSFRVFSSFARCVYAAVLKQNDCVGSGLGDHFLVHLTLQPETLVISDKVRFKSCN
jgi:hypothetical protein